MSTNAITLTLASELENTIDPRYANIRSAVKSRANEKRRGKNLSDSFTSERLTAAPFGEHTLGIKITSISYPLDDTHLVATDDVHGDYGRGSELVHTPKGITRWNKGYLFILKRIMALRIQHAHQQPASKPRFSVETLDERAQLFAETMMNYRFSFHNSNGNFTIANLCLDLRHELIDYASDFGLVVDFILDPQDIDYPR